ncbi:MAG: chromate efflux transporter [Chthonomonas sp.]|nr:chromate efflux transporter [Chthonomonas sp.]
MSELPEAPNNPGNLFEIATVFLRLGSTAFGGPAVHLAMMEEEFVRVRKWLTHQELADLMGAANLVPGPNSTEVAIHVGLRRGGVPGMFLAGACFILPAALIVAAIAWAYVQYQRLPAVQSALYGIKPVVVAIVAQAIFSLVSKVVETWPKRFVLVIAFVLSVFKVNELLLIFGSGLLLGGTALKSHRRWADIRPLLLLLGTISVIAVIPLGWELTNGTSLSTSPLNVFLYFLKLGSVLYGSGYVLLSFLQADLVLQWKWLSQAQLFDAVAVGQFTPGPVFTTATFIGYILCGWQGAIAATVGIFLPAFVFVAIGEKLLTTLRSSELTSGFMDGVSASALGLIAAVLVEMGSAAFVDATSVMVALASLAVLLRFKINSAWLIAAGAVIGICSSAIAK